MKSRILLAASVAAMAAVALPAAAQDWTGGYVSLHLGGSLADDDESERTLFDTNLDGNFGDTVRTTTNADAFASSATTPAGFCGGTERGNNFAAGCNDDDQLDAELGVRAGWDWAMGGFVVGGLVEASSSRVDDNAVGFSTTPANYTFERGLKDVLYAARARIGLPYDRALFYGTGGVAFAKIDENYRTSNTGNTFTPISGESDGTGFQVGGGVEYMVNDRVSLGAEYLYTSLDVDDPLVTRIGRGTQPATNPFILVNANGTDNRRESDEFNFHAFRLTISSRF